jgi:hypothetical protein
VRPRLSVWATQVRFVLRGDSTLRGRDTLRGVDGGCRGVGARQEQRHFGAREISATAPSSRRPRAIRLMLLAVVRPDAAGLHRGDRVHQPVLVLGAR